jgi:hypothetical protein
LSRRVTIRHQDVRQHVVGIGIVVNRRRSTFKKLLLGGIWRGAPLADYGNAGSRDQRSIVMIV